MGVEMAKPLLMHTKTTRQLPVRGQGHGLVDGTAVGGAVSHKEECHVVPALRLNGHGRAHGDGRVAAQGTRHAEDAIAEPAQVVDAAAAAGVAGLFGQDLAKERIQRIADQIRGTDDAVRELEIIAGFSRGQHADKGGLLARAAVNVAGGPGSRHRDPSF